MHFSEMMSLDRTGYRGLKIRKLIIENMFINNKTVTHILGVT